MQELTPDVVLTLLMFMDEKARKRNKEINIVNVAGVHQCNSTMLSLSYCSYDVRGRHILPLVFWQNSTPILIYVRKSDKRLNLHF